MAFNSDVFGLYRRMVTIGSLSTYGPWERSSNPRRSLYRRASSSGAAIGHPTTNPRHTRDSSLVFDIESNNGDRYLMTSLTSSTSVATAISAGFGTLKSLYPSLNILASGPYGLIFASFIPFYFDIPVSSRFRVFGMHLTNKSFVYLAGLQLIFSCWKRSLLPGICGILAGSLYRLNLFGIRKIKIPDVVSSFTSRLRWPSGSSSHTSSSGNATRPILTFPGHHAEGNNPFTVHATAQDPTEASVATLVSMGFDDNSARQALMHAGNDVNAATNILLESQSL